MTDSLRQGGCLETAFLQAEGELRQHAISERTNVSPRPAEPELQIASTRNWQRLWHPVERTHPTTRRPTTIQYP